MASVATEEPPHLQKTMRKYWWCVSILYSSDESKVGKFKAIDRALAIGREGGPDDLVLADPQLSRTHARLKQIGPLRFEIEDHSKNGTFVEGVRVDGRATVAPGQLIRVGDTLLELDEATLSDAHWREDGEMLGRALVFRHLRDAIDRVARTDLTVLVIGETGTGKELVAKRIHAMSERQGPLVAVNCGALPANLIESALFGHKRGAFTDAQADVTGYFTAAAGGTLFLDEIGVLPLDLQPKLLRVLENREYTVVGTTTPRRTDARVIAATNADLVAESAAGRFRKDLYARLAQLQLDVPPLRARRRDVLSLFRHFLCELSEERARALTVSVLFAEALLLYDWPLNLRELKALAQRLVVLTDHNALTEDDLPPAMRQQAGAQRPATKEERPQTHPAQADKAELELALRELGGNLSAVAARFGRSRMQLYRWLEKYQIDPEAYRR